MLIFSMFYIVLDLFDGNHTILSGMMILIQMMDEIYETANVVKYCANEKILGFRTGIM